MLFYCFLWKDSVGEARHGKRAIRKTQGNIRRIDEQQQQNIVSISTTTITAANVPTSIDSRPTRALFVVVVVFGIIILSKQWYHSSHASRKGLLREQRDQLRREISRYRRLEFKLEPQLRRSHRRYGPGQKVLVFNSSQSSSLKSLLFSL